MSRIYNHIFLVIFMSLLSNLNSFGQCSLTYSPNTCLQVGQTVTFNYPLSGLGQIEDPNGSITSIGISPFQYLLSLSGTYSVFGFFGGPCIFTLEVITQPINLSVSTNSIIMCSGSSIDYNSLGINISNAVGPANYDWVVYPSGQNWTGLTSYPIPSGQNSVILTITDTTTGCTDSETINLSYQTTQANASFNSSGNTITCPGQSLIFTASNINTTLYNYSWGINGIIQSGGANGVITPYIYPTGNTANVALYVEDLNNGCIVQTSQTLNVNSPDYIALNTNLSNFDTILNLFAYCETDSLKTDTFYNAFSNSSGIDYVIIDNGFTQQTINSGFNTFYIDVSELVSEITITTYFTGGCDSIILSYDVLYNKTFGTVNSNFGQQVNSSLCIGDEVNYFIDPTIFTMPLNGKIFFYVICDSINTDTIVWDYDSVVINTYFVDADNDISTPDVEKIVFSYDFDNSSCGCVWSDGTTLQYDLYRVWPKLITNCQIKNLTLGEETYIPPDATASFIVPDSMCPGATATIINQSDFGCQNSQNPFYQPDNFDLVKPSFFYDWGNCDTSTYFPVENQYSSNNFLSSSYTYSNAGIYHVKLFAINTCDSILFEDSITIFPKPNVSFISDKVCEGDITIFTSSTFSSTATTDTITCISENIIINVPAGLPITTYLWSMGSNLGQYTNGTSNASPNPQFIFNSCGEYFVNLTVTDSLGCDSTYTNTVTIYELPIPIFTTNNVCEGNPTCINDLSQYNQNNNCYGFF